MGRYFLTIGTYDGVHLGHNKLLRALVREAAKRGKPCVVAYFPLPPKFFFSGETKNNLITLPAEREALIKALGVKRVIDLPFNAGVANMSADDFFYGVVLKRHRAAGLFVGHDFAVGKGREGHADYLRKRCTENGIYFKEMAFVTRHGHKVSSSLIRAMLKNSKVEEANKCLGWNYFVGGKVVRGAGIGRQLGFPTANIAHDTAKILPPGVFAAAVRLGGKRYRAVVNVGARPTISGDGRKLLEAHILGFRRNIYGRYMEVEFLRHLRSERHFCHKEALKAQISEDIAAAKSYFSLKTSVEVFRPHSGRPSGGMPDSIS